MAAFLLFSLFTGCSSSNSASLSVRLVYPDPGAGPAATAAPAGTSVRAAYPTDNTNRILIRILAPHIPAPMEAWFDRSAGHGEISGIPPGDRIVVEVDEYDNTARTLFTAAPLLGRGWTQGVSLGPGQFKTVPVTMYARGAIVRVCGAAPVSGAGTPGDGGDGGLADNATLNNPLSVKVGPGDEIFVASTGAKRIRKIDRYGFISHYAGDGTDNAIAEGMDAATAPIGSVFDMDFDGAGNLYFINWVQQIIKIDKITEKIVVKYGGQPLDIFAKPDLAVVNDNSIFYSNGLDNRVYLVQDGIRTDYVADNTPWDTSEGADRLHYPLKFPKSVSSSPYGSSIIFADYENHMVKAADVAFSAIFTKVGGGATATFTEGMDPRTIALSYPYWIESDNIYRNLFYRERDFSRIRVLRRDNLLYGFAGGDTAGFSGDGGPATAARLNNPAGVAVDSRGNVYIADSDNHAIRVVVGGALP